MYAVRNSTRKIIKKLTVPFVIYQVVAHVVKDIYFLHLKTHIVWVVKLYGTVNL